MVLHGESETQVLLDHCVEYLQVLLVCSAKAQDHLQRLTQ